MRSGRTMRGGGCARPSVGQLSWRKEAHEVSDRALRYRANACPPPGPPVCCLYGSMRNVEVGHVNGHEEDTGTANLFWTCRSCSVRCGNTLRAAGLGRLTHQSNPAQGAKSLGQWLTAIASMKRESSAMPVARRTRTARRQSTPAVGLTCS